MAEVTVHQLRAAQLLVEYVLQAAKDRGVQIGLSVMKQDVDLAIAGEMETDQLIAGYQYLRTHSGYPEIRETAESALTLLGADHKEESI